MILPSSNMDIPLRTQLSEVFGTYLSRKHNISIIIFSNKTIQYKWKSCQIYEINRLNDKFKIRQSIIFLKTLKKILKQKKVDVVFFRSIGVVQLFFYILFKIIKIPIILQLTVILRKINNAKVIEKPFVYLRLKTLLKISNLILPISDWMNLILQKFFLLSPFKSFTFPDGVNLEKFDNYEEKISKQDNNNIVYIGTLDSDRNMSFLIKCMRIVVNEINNAKLLILGKGEDEADLIKLTSKLSLNENISFKGYIEYNQIPRYLKFCMIGVSPIPPKFYYRVSSPLKLFEYMGAGLAVVANREIIEHRKVLNESNGGILTSYDIKKFANSIIYLLKNPNLIKVMGNNNNNWVKNNRNYQVLANRLEVKLLSMIEKKENR